MTLEDECAKRKEMNALKHAGKRYSVPRVRKETMRRPNWTEAEDQILRKHYQTYGASGCTAMLPMRTYDSILARASMIGLAVKRDTRAPLPRPAALPPAKKLTTFGEFNLPVTAGYTYGAQRARDMLAANAAAKAALVHTPAVPLRYARAGGRKVKLQA